MKAPDEIENALYEIYNDASSLEWQKIDGFWVGEFRYSDNSFRAKAWFDQAGKWQMTETTELTYKLLPEEIINDFENNRNCTKENILNIYRVEFADVETRYILEVEKSGSVFFLFYRRKGDLLKIEEDSWTNKPIVIEEGIKKYLAENHETGVIIDADLSSTPLKVEIFENSNKTVCFKKPTQWIATYWEVKSTDITEAALKAFYEITGKKEADKQFKLIYNADIDTLASATMVNAIEEYPRAFLFLFNNGEKICIDEYGNEITEIIFPI